MDPRFAQFPRDLARRARTEALGPSRVPALLAHPDWSTPAPVAVWLHGRTVNKELDPGRYLRWVRAGIAAVALDLPGHGERFDEDLQSPRRTLDVLERAVPEIDGVVAALRSRPDAHLFDTSRLALGGMSAGGMVTLRRLCDEHPFACAAVEATTGDLGALYAGTPGRPWPASHPPERVRALSALPHLEGWRPIPLLVLHSEADATVPFAAQAGFLGALRSHYETEGADPSLIELRTWPETGAPQEHAGFGRFGNEAKNAQVEFLARHLRAVPPAEG